MKLGEEKITFLKISSLISSVRTNFSIKGGQKLAILFMTPFAAKDSRTKPRVWRH